VGKVQVERVAYRRSIAKVSLADGPILAGDAADAVMEAEE
jgi:hypothetical protein